MHYLFRTEYDDRFFRLSGMPFVNTSIISNNTSCIINKDSVFTRL